MLDLYFVWGGHMAQIELVKALMQEIEDLLFDKLKRQEKCLNYYALIDDSVRQELLIRTFERIDLERDEIQKIDLQFLSKYEKVKQLYGIKALEELAEGERKSFEMVQNAVTLASKRHAELESLRLETDVLRGSIQKEFLLGNRKATAVSAYKNINKI